VVGKECSHVRGAMYRDPEKAVCEEVERRVCEGASTTT